MHQSLGAVFLTKTMKMVLESFRLGSNMGGHDISKRFLLAGSDPDLMISFSSNIELSSASVNISYNYQ